MQLMNTLLMIWWWILVLVLGASVVYYVQQEYELMKLNESEITKSNNNIDEQLLLDKMNSLLEDETQVDLSNSINEQKWVLELIDQEPIPAPIKEIIEQIVETEEVWLDQEDVKEDSKEPNTIRNNESLLDENTIDWNMLSQPDVVKLDMTFFSQAPVWDRSQPWQDACEEASIILAAYYLSQKPLDRTLFTSEILELVDLQNTLFWSYVDTTLDQTKELYDIYFWIWTSEILLDPTIDDIKKALADEKVIVAPFAGKLLGNIYYSNGGPRYHMLVISGYTEDSFYTHDVGTKRGEGYIYSQQVIMDALHDFVPVSQWAITQWAKKILVLTK